MDSVFLRFATFHCFCCSPKLLEKSCSKLHPFLGGKVQKGKKAGLGYRVVLGHRNWQVETAGWIWAGFFTKGLETHWQRCGQFLNDV